MTDDADHYARLHAIFDVARRRSRAERAAFLVAACGDDEVLRADVESLLAAGLDTEAADVLSDAHLVRVRETLQRLIDEAADGGAE